MNISTPRRHGGPGRDRASAVRLAARAICRADVPAITRGNAVRFALVLGAEAGDVAEASGVPVRAVEDLAQRR